MHADLERGLSHRMKWIAQAGHAAIATQKIKVGAELTPLALAVAGEEGEEQGGRCGICRAYVADQPNSADRHKCRGNGVRSLLYRCIGG